MIDQATVERIIEAAQIQEVIGDFVSLRKRGVNLLGHCPFHNEKTPSFTVSPAKGIYKCFGCGKGGNSVNFIMDLEQLSYVEALKYLAKKYGIEVVEKELTPKEKEHQDDRESMLIVTEFAQKHFKKNLFNSDEGKAIGLSYFKERGFRDDIIEKFELGYCLNQQEGFTRDAKNNGYKTKYLEKTGLTIVKDNFTADRFRGRVMFPIHSVAGKVIGFGGRILTDDKKTAKYLNSPESEIYNKSRTLYGVYYAKRAITQNDKCFLVEGYTDVISFHQAGIENVVASSGTSLTAEQIKLIRRFTPNITIVYDGDSAGIKASFRGINMILEEGLNVKVLLMPEGEDPDSFAKSRSSEELELFIRKNETDFISFKTSLLKEETSNDPIKRANLITDIVETIALIPNEITRAVYVQESANILSVDEQVLRTQVVKLRRNKIHKGQSKYIKDKPAEKLQQAKVQAKPTVTSEEEYCMYQEQEILRLLLLYGNDTLYHSEDLSDPVSIKDYVFAEIVEGEMLFINAFFNGILEEYFNKAVQSSLDEAKYFVNHIKPEISEFVANVISYSEELSQFWKKKGGYIITEDMVKKEMVEQTILLYKSKRIELMIKEIDAKLKDYTSLSNEEMMELMSKKMEFQKFQQMITKDLGGRTVLNIGH